MTDNDAPKIGGLLLAAGGSSRFGSPKQVAEFQGKTLIRRAAEVLAASVCDPIVIVLGSETEKSAAEIADLAAHVTVNADWQSGMSSSIKSGITRLRELEPQLAAVIITLCDQPYVTTEKIDQFAIEFVATGAPIIAGEYNGTRGVPCLFSRALFDKLRNLTGDRGARDLIRSFDGVSTISLEEAAFDIDSPDDISEPNK